MNINAFNSVKALTDADNAAQNGDFSKAEILLSEIAQRNTEDFPVLLRLAIVRRRRGDYKGALDALSTALLVRPCDLPALLMQRNILHAFGRREEAAKAYAKALTVAGSAGDLPLPLRAELERAVATVSEHEAWRDKIAAVELRPGNPVKRARLEKLRDDILPGADGQLMFDGLPIRSFYDGGDFTGVSEFEAATPQILAEFQALIA